MILLLKIFFIFLPQSGIKQSVAHASFRVLRPSLTPMPAIMRSRLCGCLRQAGVRALRRGFHLASERSKVVARQVVPEPVRHQLATIF